MNHATPLRPLLVIAALALLAGCNKEIPIPKDPPEARKDYARTALDTPVTLAPVANDYDADDAVLTVVAIGQPAHGAAVLNPDSTVTYTPATGYLGGDEFTVTVRDGHGHEVTESAYVTVGDSVRFVYASNFVDYWTRELYISDSAHPGVPLPVSARFALTEGPVVPGEGVSRDSFTFVQSSDGQAVVYIADDDDTRFTANLFYVDLDRPGVAIKLTDMPSGRLPVLNQLPKFSPDKQFVYYMSNEFNPDTYEIVRVEVANPANKVRMNPALVSVTLPTTPDPTTAWETIPRFDLSPDGSRILFVKFDPDLMTSTTGARELYVVDTATPGVATKVSGTPTTGTGGVLDSFGSSLGFRLIDDHRVVYPATEGGSTLIDLWLADYVSLSTPVKLNVAGAATSGGVSSFRLTPDGTRVVFEANHAAATKTDLFTVEIANPGVETQLSARRADGLSGQVYQVSADSATVVYISDEDSEGISEMYAVDLAAPASKRKLNHALRAAAKPIPAEEVQTWFQFSAGDPRHVIYSTNGEPVDGATPQSMRRVSLDTPSDNVVIGSSFAAGFIFMWHPDGDTVVAFDDPDRRNVISGYEMKASDAAHRVKLTPERYPGASIEVSVNFPYLP